MQDIVYKLVPGLQEGESRRTQQTNFIRSTSRGENFFLCLLFLFYAAEIKKQREFYQKLGMEVPGDIKGELCNMKTHLDQRNGTNTQFLGVFSLT